MSEPKTNDELEAYYKKEFISPTEAQRITRHDLRADEYQISKSKYGIDYIQYMESKGWVLRVQDDRFVYIRIERDGSYITTQLDRD